MVDFDWSSIVSRATLSSGRAVLFSAESVQLILDAAALLHDRFRWSAADNAQWDTIEAAISRAQDEMMDNPFVGQIIWRAGGIRENELLCDGSTYNRVDYPDLYDVLDIAYIIDADSFRVPDLAHKVMVGEGDSWVVGDTGGEETVTLSIEEMPAHAHTSEPHAHTYTPPVFNIDIEAPGAPDVFAAGIGLPTSTSAVAVTISSAGGGEAHNNMQPYEVLTPCLIAR